jgi:hypothetical protein
MGMVPGMSPLYGMGGIPGAGNLSGLGQFPGMTGWPGSTPGGWGYPGAYGYGNVQGAASLLDGAWELDKGGFVVIKGNTARLYVSREQFQDFTLGYDRQYLWWAPASGGSSSRYRYQMRDGRMILRDSDGNYLLLRRRR